MSGPAVVEDTRAKLALLLEALTDKDKLRLEPVLCSCLIEILKRGGGSYVEAAAQLLWRHLEADHAQTRLLALLFVDKVFCCSLFFRRWLCKRFSAFLELSVGIKIGRPLPGPAAAAQELKSTSISIILAWGSMFGRTCPQVVTACRHLQALGMTVPDSNLPNNESDARRRRTQQLLVERFDALPAQVQELSNAVDAALVELEECLSILPEVPRPSSTSHGLTAADVAAHTDVHAPELTAHCEVPAQPAHQEEDIEWEDVAVASIDSWVLAGSSARLGLKEGLTGYSPILAQAPKPQDMEATTSSAPEDAKSVLVQNIREICRQLGSSLPKLQEWLRLLARLDTDQSSRAAAYAGGSRGLGSTAGLGISQSLGLGARRDRMLRNLLSIKSKVQDALSRAEEATKDDACSSDAPQAPAAPAHAAASSYTVQLDATDLVPSSSKTTAADLVDSTVALQLYAQRRMPSGTSSGRGWGQARGRGGCGLEGGRESRGERMRRHVSGAREESSRHNTQVLMSSSDACMAESLQEEQLAAMRSEKQGKASKRPADCLRASLGLRPKR